MLLKIVLFISFVFAFGSISIAGDLGRSTSLTKAGDVFGTNDTLVSLSGKIVDSVTKTPVPYATITFYKLDSSSVTMVANEIGEFSTGIKHLQSKIKISAIGFEEQINYLATNHPNLVLLKPAGNTLPGVIVSSKGKKKVNASRIIKEVNKHFEQNYGSFSFDQIFKVGWKVQNYDSIKCEKHAELKFRFINEQKIMLSGTWHEDTITCDAAFLQFIGNARISFGDIGTRGDILRREMVLGEKKRKRFDFRLLAHYEDKLQGPVYLVSFRPLGTTLNDFFMNSYNLPLGYLKGEMIIRENDFAVVSIKYTWEMKVDPFNQSIESAFHSQYWKADKLSKIIANPVILHYDYTYMKDSLTGKYFLHKIKADSYESGYQIENHRSVKMNYQYIANSLGVAKIED